MKQHASDSIIIKNRTSANIEELNVRILAACRHERMALSLNDALTNHHALNVGSDRRPNPMPVGLDRFAQAVPVPVDQSNRRERIVVELYEFVSPQDNHRVA